MVSQENQDNTELKKNKKKKDKNKNKINETEEKPVEETATKTENAVVQETVNKDALIQEALKK